VTAGVNAKTGMPLAGFPHVVQSLGKIFATKLGKRIMRRIFGSNAPGLLGQNLTPSTLMKFYMAIIIAIELWEPRFSVKTIIYPGNANSASNLGQGKFGVQISGNYMPNALEGDFTVASIQTVTL
jgi:phage baseplate assembly protein W